MIFSSISLLFHIFNYFQKNFRLIKIIKHFITLLLIGLSSINSNAQEPELVDTFWYLKELNIEGITIIPPDNDEIDTATLEFLSSTNGYLINTCVCYCGLTDFVQIGNETIQFDNMSFLITESCDLAENAIFQDQYFVDFFQSETTDVSEPIGYEILTDSEGNKQLTLTNNNGDLAIYGDQLLYTLDNTAATFSLVTNPVQHNLELQFPIGSHNRTVQIYDIVGKLVKSTTSNQEANLKLDVSVLERGMYLVVVSEGSKQSIRKFIKR